MVYYKLQLLLLPTGSRGLQYASYKICIIKMLIKIQIKIYDLGELEDHYCMHVVDIYVPAYFYNTYFITSVL